MNKDLISTLTNGKQPLPKSKYTSRGLIVSMKKKKEVKEIDFTPWFKKLADGTNTDEDDKQIVAALKIISDYAKEHSQHPLPTKE